MRATATIALLTAATAMLAAACADGGDDADADPADVIEALEQIENAPELIDPSELAGDSAVQITLPESGTLPPPDTQPLRPLTANELDIEIDDEGRPYEVQRGWYERGEHATESLGLMSVPNGELRIIDGIAAAVDLGFFADEATAVSLGTYDRLAITVHQLVTTLGDDDLEGDDPDGDDPEEGDPEGDDRAADDPPVTVTQIVAVRLDVIGGGSVERWEPFEFAYGTDGGSGGVTSEAVLGAAVESTDDGLDDLDPSRLDNLLGGDLPDLLVFSNGVGDGAFPMSRGLDRNGDVVSIVLPSLTYPWRLMIADGEPPIDVTARETEYLECLRGTRPLTVDGDCLNDPT